MISVSPEGEDEDDMVLTEDGGYQEEHQHPYTIAWSARDMTASKTLLPDAGSDNKSNYGTI